MGMIEFNGKQYDTRHGGPWDRGSADSYYGRGLRPHYYVGNTMQSEMVPREQMTREELEAYCAGFEYNETVEMDFKDWGYEITEDSDDEY
jgi:hypothetical protein